MVMVGSVGPSPALPTTQSIQQAERAGKDMPGGTAVRPPEGWPFPCTVEGCEKGSLTKHGLIMHQRLSHNPTARKPGKPAGQRAREMAAELQHRRNISRVEELHDPIEIATRVLWPPEKGGVPYNKVQEVAQWQRDTAELLSN